MAIISVEVEANLTTEQVQRRIIVEIDLILDKRNLTLIQRNSMRKTLFDACNTEITTEIEQMQNSKIVPEYCFNQVIKYRVNKTASTSGASLQQRHGADSDYYQQIATAMMSRMRQILQLNNVAEGSESTNKLQTTRSIIPYTVEYIEENGLEGTCLNETAIAFVDNMVKKSNPNYSLPPSPARIEKTTTRTVGGGSDTTDDTPNNSHCNEPSVSLVITYFALFYTFYEITQ